MAERKRLKADDIALIRNLLANTKLTTGEIGERVGVNADAIRSRGVKLGFDMKARAIACRKKTNLTEVSAMYLTTLVPESMSRDGRSLQFLTEGWK